MNRETRMFLLGLLMMFLGMNDFSGYVKLIGAGATSFEVWLGFVATSICAIQGVIYLYRSMEQPKAKLPKNCKCSCGNESTLVAVFGRCGKCLDRII